MGDEDLSKRTKTEEQPPDDGEAEYSFEGFKVEFNDRIALTPPPTASGKLRNG